MSGMELLIFYESMSHIRGAFDDGLGQNVSVVISGIPQCGPQYIIIRMMGTLKKLPLILGAPHHI